MKSRAGPSVRLQYAHVGAYVLGFIACPPRVVGGCVWAASCGPLAHTHAVSQAVAADRDAAEAVARSAATALVVAVAVRRALERLRRRGDVAVAELDDCRDIAKVE